MLENYKDVLDVNEMREILQIGQNTAYHLLRSGAIRSIRVGRNIRIPKSAMLEYLAGEHPAAADHSASPDPSADWKDR